VVRISGYEVLREGSQVIKMIREQVIKRMQELGIDGDGTSSRTPLTPDPSPRGGERGDERE
jgi:hypothetical protein